MAPSNTYLTEDTVRQLAAHNNHLIKRTTIEFPGEDPEVHWDFHRPVEYELLGGFLDRYAEPDFTDGKVTVAAAGLHVYGAVDEYLLSRTAGMMTPASAFNKAYSVNGLVYVVSPNGAVLRGNRTEIALRILDDRAGVARERVGRVATTQLRGIEAAARKALRTDPASRAVLEARQGEVLAQIQSGLWEQPSENGE